MIDAAAISKGSMYYDFDGKEDLYTHVTRVELELLFACVGPFPIPTETDPDTFWSTLEGYYLRLMTTLAASPQLAALIRGWLAASNSALQHAQQELERGKPLGATVRAAFASSTDAVRRAGQRGCRGNGRSAEQQRVQQCPRYSAPPSGVRQQLNAPQQD